MTVLFSKRSLQISGRTFVTPDVALDPLTDHIRIRIARPTTGGTVTWVGKMRIAIIITADGVVHRCEGGASGGIRVHDGEESPFYELSYAPTWGRFGVTSAPMKRLGQTVAAYTVRVEVVAEGSIDSDVEVTSGESAAPLVAPGIG